MKIRKLQLTDIPQASKIVGSNYSKKYEKLSFKEMEAMYKNYTVKPEYLVVEEKGKIIGLAGYIQSWMDYHIYNIFRVNVMHKRQGKGIGTQLIKHIIQKIKEKKGGNKAYVIQLTTTKPKFYERFGFKSEFEYKKGEILMSLRLK